MTGVQTCALPILITYMSKCEGSLFSHTIIIAFMIRHDELTMMLIDGELNSFDDWATMWEITRSKNPAIAMGQWCFHRRVTS